MARRSGNPALYEMMRSRSAQDGSAAPLSTSPRTAFQRRAEPSLVIDEGGPAPSRLPEKIADLFKPGRTLRVPVGYVFLALAIAIIMLWLTYMIGNSRGYAHARADLEDKFRSQQRSSGVNDPLSLAPKNQALPALSPPSANDLPSNTPRSDLAKTLAYRPRSMWGEVTPKAEPRKKGWRYYIVAEAAPKDAVRLAEFCRANDLEAYVVESNNSSRRRVIILPGFQGPSTAPEVKALEARIHEVGDIYKSQHKGHTDMRDAIPPPYDG